MKVMKKSKNFYRKRFGGAKNLSYLYVKINKVYGRK